MALGHVGRVRGSRSAADRTRAPGIGPQQKIPKSQGGQDGKRSPA